MKFLYLPSAFQSSGSFLEAYKLYPQLTLDLFYSVKNQEQDTDLGILENAFTDPENLKQFYNIFEKNNDTVIMADSGGLQVITRGKEVTKEIKNKIFNSQMNYSNYAMSFDEIPMIVTEKNPGTFGDKKVFIDSLFKKNAILSGQNMVEQIKVFKKNKTKAKILFIIQSKTFETAREWAWFAFQEVKKEPEYEKYIGGLAIGNTGSGGLRNLADFMLRFQSELDFLPLEWRKRLHVLGAGSISRIVAAMLIRDEYFLEDTVISADATTQTRAQLFGNYQWFNKKTKKLESVSAGREYNDTSHLVIEKIYEKVKPHINKHKDKYNIQAVCIDTFREQYTEYNEGLFRRKNQFLNDYEYRKRARVSRYFWTMSMISYYLEYLETVKKMSKLYRKSTQEIRTKILKKFKNIIPNNLYKPFIKILDINNHLDYMKGSNILSGHPYKIELPEKYKDQEIVKINNKLYITDYYNGKVLARLLKSQKVGTDGLSPVNLRNIFLGMMDGVKIDTVKVEEDLDKKEDLIW